MHHCRHCRRCCCSSAGQSAINNNQVLHEHNSAMRCGHTRRTFKLEIADSVALARLCIASSWICDRTVDSATVKPQPRPLYPLSQLHTQPPTTNHHSTTVTHSPTTYPPAICLTCTLSHTAATSPDNPSAIANTSRDRCSPRRSHSDTTSEAREPTSVSPLRVRTD